MESVLRCGRSPRLAGARSSQITEVQASRPGFSEPPRSAAPPQAGSLRTIADQITSKPSLKDLAIIGVKVAVRAELRLFGVLFRPQIRDFPSLERDDGHASLLSPPVAEPQHTAAWVTNPNGIDLAGRTSASPSRTCRSPPGTCNGPRGTRTSPSGIVSPLGTRPRPRGPCRSPSGTWGAPSGACLALEDLGPRPSGTPLGPGASTSPRGREASLKGRHSCSGARRVGGSFGS